MLNYERFDVKFIIVIVTKICDKLKYINTIICFLVDTLKMKIK